jgi:Zn-dependent peptidase ImmA (M78 family)
MNCYVPALDTWFLFRDLPKGSGGFITRDGDDTNYIIVNDNLSEREKLIALIHEFVHLYRKDLDSEKSREEIEREVVIEC